MVDFFQPRGNCPPVAMVYPIQVAPSAGPDFDKVILCDPTSGLPVLVVSSYGSTGIPQSSAYNLDGTVYPGAISALVNCPDVDQESDPIIMCDSGVTFTRWVVKKDGVPTGQVVDTTMAGAPYVATGAEVPGVCPAVASDILVWIEKSGGVVNMSDIVAATGSQKILSVTVKQIAGEGSVTADTGSGVPLSAGETWSWSSVSEGNVDTLSASVLRLDAGSGEQRITATYVR